MTPWRSGAVNAGRSAAAASVIAASLLPLAVGQREVAEERGEEQERDHRHRDRRPLAEPAARNRALEGERRHQGGGVNGPAARDGVDELEVGEGEQRREGPNDGQRRKQR